MALFNRIGMFEASLPLGMMVVMMVVVAVMAIMPRIHSRTVKICERLL